MKELRRPASSERCLNAALLAGLCVIFFLQLRNPIIRFEWPIANSLFGLALGLSLPWLTVFLIYRIGRWWSNTIALIAVIPLLLYTALFVIVADLNLSYKDGRNLSFDRFAETHWKGSEVRLYRTDGGATTDFGLVIRHERGLIPGVLLVRSLDAFYPCYSLDTVTTDVGVIVRDERSQCRDLGVRREYRLKPFIYF